MDFLHKEHSKAAKSRISGKSGHTKQKNKNIEIYGLNTFSDLRMQDEFCQSLQENTHLPIYNFSESFLKTDVMEKSPVIQRRLDFNRSGLTVTHDQFEQAIYSFGSQMLMDLFKAVDKATTEIFYSEHATPIGFGPSELGLVLNIPKDIWPDQIKLGSVLGHELQHAYDWIYEKNRMKDFDKKMETELNAWCSECIVAMEMMSKSGINDTEALSFIDGFRQCVLDRSYNNDPLISGDNKFLQRLENYCKSYNTDKSKTANELMNDYLRQGNNRDKVMNACWVVFENYERIFHPD